MHVVQFLAAGGELEHPYHPAIAEVHRRVALPVFCIGGINPQTLPDVVAAGARRVVIVSALLTADDPAAAARRALALLPASRGQ